MSIHSYNAGYHRGLNTEYHNIPVEVLFKQWAEGTDILLIPVAFDPVAFERGYADGVRDYLKDRNCVEDQLAKEISEMSDEEVKNNIDKNFLYWQNRKEELQRCIDTGTIFEITEEDKDQEIIFLKQERERLIKKLEKIESLSRYAWEQVKRNPQEAEELFRMIYAGSK